jgi:hypothetical protein
MTPRLRLRVLYLNPEGLTPPKYLYYTELLDANRFDLIAVGEFWLPRFLNRTRFHLLFSSRNP